MTLHLINRQSIEAFVRNLMNGYAKIDHVHEAATQAIAGFLSASDKKKLDGVSEGANKYTHPSHDSRVSGLYKITVDALGHVSAASTVVKDDITALGIPGTDTNTVYVHPSASGNKHIPAGGTAGQILRWSADGTALWGADNNTTYSPMTGAAASSAGKAGLVPAPAAGASTRYLRSDGTWQIPPDNNTTYGVATQSANGLMSAGDKKKLDNSFPVGKAIFSYSDLNPAALYGGTWTVRTDTYMFMGMRIYRRTA